MYYCGLTATPELLTQYVAKYSEFNFVDITPNYPIKHKAAKIEIIEHSTLNTYLKSLDLDENNKALAYIRSAKSIVNLASKYENAVFGISKYNKDIDRRTGKILADIMNEQTVNVDPFGVVPANEYILKNKLLPKGKSLYIINDAFAAGVNIDDEKVRTVIVDSCDLAIIRQAKGRIRHDIDKLVIIYNFKEYKSLLRNIDRVNRFYGNPNRDIKD